MELKRLFSQIHPTWKDAIVKKIRIILQIMTQPEIPSLDNMDLQTAYALLGRIEFRLFLLLELEKQIADAWGVHSFIPRKVEIFKDLRELTKKQLETVRKLVRVYVYRDYQQSQPEKAAQPQAAPTS
jgi:hypothetical protein